MSFSNKFHEVLAAQAQAALIAVVAGQPNTTVTELSELLAAYPTLGATTLATLLGGGGGAKQPPAKRRGRPPGSKSKSAAAPAKAKPKAAVSVGKPKASPASPAKAKTDASLGKPNVRTEAGREQFDRDLFAALTSAGGDMVNASTLRGAVGGDPNQIRAALNRLIELGQVTFTGKARGTRYSLARG